MVGKQASGDGIFDGGNSQQGGVCGHPVEEEIETRTGKHFDLTVGEVASGGGFVIASCDALYGDLLHVCKRLLLKKNPARVVVRDFREFIRCLFESIQGIDAYRPAFSRGKKEKVIKEVCKAVKSHSSVNLTGYKYTKKF